MLDDAGGIAQIRSSRSNVTPLRDAHTAQLQFLGGPIGDPVLSVQGGRQYSFTRKKDYVATVRMEDVSYLLKRWPGRFRVVPATAEEAV